MAATICPHRAVKEVEGTPVALSLSRSSREDIRHDTQILAFARRRPAAAGKAVKMDDSRPASAAVIVRPSHRAAPDRGDGAAGVRRGRARGVRGMPAPRRSRRLEAVARTDRYAQSLFHRHLQNFQTHF